MSKIEFKRNEETGIVEVWKDGKKVGEMETMGDDIIHGDTFQGQQLDNTRKNRKVQKRNA